ncbi:hypothetical protein C8J57DRAFT_1237064 [Mycena rebaudengoi]|nr:hypothetical protein C8J57DRAFT_1237064 [Mycena rebaudengoi]
MSKVSLFNSRSNDLNDLAMMPIELKIQFKLATLNIPTSRCNGRRPFLYCRSIYAIFFRTPSCRLARKAARAPAVYKTCPSGASGHMSERRVDEQRSSNVVCAYGVSTMARKHSSVGSTPEMKPARVSGMSSTVCMFAKACTAARGRSR